jgi:hypothetical protein
MKMRRIYWLAVERLAFQEILCSVEYVSKGAQTCDKKKHERQFRLVFKAVYINHSYN